MDREKIRVRFAPSPTGPLHIGGVRTALFNYLFAKKHGGAFILRIEDTDQNRFVEGAEQYILDAFAWCGIQFDEGIHAGGPFAPYRQSERKELYGAYAERLIKDGYAYYAFDTPDELDQMRQKLEKAKMTNTSYSYLCRMEMRNSLSLDEQAVRKELASGTPYVVRFRMPEDTEVVFQDIIRGEIRVHTSTLDDKVLFKSDGMPTYHLANVVDDHLMEISHVIRGEEWLPSLPLHILLYRAFGWEETMPLFAHMPLTLKPDGKGKLSKRDGDRLGFPVFPLEWKNPVTGEISSGYREAGYFPEAFINILAFLGWNPGTEQEMFSMEELIQAFSLERIGKSGSRFDPDKAKWYNHQYLIQKEDKELAELFLAELNKKGITVPLEYVTKVVSLVKERVDFVRELWEHSSFFFVAPDQYDENMVKKRWKDDTPALLRGLIHAIEKAEPFTSEAIHAQIQLFLETNNVSMGAVMPPVRLALVGSGKGPGVTEIMEVLGKEEVTGRMEKAIEKLS